MGRTINSGMSVGSKGQGALENYRLFATLDGQKVKYYSRSKIYPHSFPMTNQTPNSTQIQNDDIGKIDRKKGVLPNGNRKI